MSKRWKPRGVRLLPKSTFGEALSYLRNHWDPLNVFVTGGRTPMNKNQVEQLMEQV